MTERTLRRWYRRYEEDGTEGLADRRLGKPSAKRVPEGWADRVEDLYRERYLGFNARHFWEHLVKDHGFPYSYSWAKTFLHRRQLVPLTARKGPHRKKRHPQNLRRFHLVQLPAPPAPQHRLEPHPSQPFRQLRSSHPRPLLWSDSKTGQVACHKDRTYRVSATLRAPTIARARLLD